MKKKFTILEHPADMGIEAYGKNLKEAFKQAAIGLMSIIFDNPKIELIKTIKVKIDAFDYEQLLVKWLNEILYLYDGANFIASIFNIKTLTPKLLIAELKGENFDNIKHPTKMDVKAITYHQIFIKENQNDCIVRVFLDI